jgi:hypothetical protein
MSNAAIHQSLAEAQAQRQADFGRYMDRFSDVFGDELFAVHSAEANVEVTQLLADCIEAGWVVWGAEPDLAVSAQDVAALDGAATGSVGAGVVAVPSADAAFQALAVGNGVAAAPSAPGNAASATAAASVASVSAKTASATKEEAASPAQQNQRPRSSRGAKTPK